MSVRAALQGWSVMLPRLLIEPCAAQLAYGADPQR